VSRIKGRTHVSTRPRATPLLKISLAPQGASTHVVNTYFATLADLEAVIAQRCIELESQDLRTGTNFYWWPKPVQPK
jgi:hypothetical protein